MVSIWTPLALPRIAERWFTLPDFALARAGAVWPRGIAAFACWQGLRSGRRAAALPRVGRAVPARLSSGLVISNVPYLVPPVARPSGTAAADPKSQMFMLVGVLILLPMILGYTVFNYWVFRGKVRAGEGYH